MKVNRRELIRQALLLHGGLRLKSLLIGVPASFLSHRVMANTNAKFLIWSSSSRGDPINCNVPGTYGPDKSFIQHSDDPDFSTPHSFMLGGQTVEAAKCWSNLSQDILDNFHFIHHRTGANGHGEYLDVLKLLGGLKSSAGNGSEMVPSCVAQENSSSLSTIVDTPVVLDRDLVTSEGNVMPPLRPSVLKSLVGSGSLLEEQNIVDIRNQALDKLYRDLKTSGTKQQRAFLDNHALSLTQAKQISSNLSPLMTDIAGNSQEDTLVCAAAMIAAGVTAVPVLRLSCGGDNHADATLSGEVNAHNNFITRLNLLQAKLKEFNIADKTVFALSNVFGRTLKRNSRGGRDHNSRHCVTILFGANIKPGVSGDIIKGRRNGEAIPFNSMTGKAENPDITNADSLTSTAKTILKACDIDEDRINKRIPSGKIIKNVV